MRQEERHRVWALALLMDKMKIDSADRHLELLKPIEERLLCAPIEAVPPVIDEVPHIGDARSRGPRLLRGNLGPAACD